MFNNISLRARVTLLSTLALLAITVILTGFSVYNARNNIITPLTQAMEVAPIAIRNPFDYVDAAEVSPSSPTINSERNDLTLMEEISSLQTSLETTVSSGNVRFMFSSVVYMLVIIVLGSILIYYISGRALMPVKKLSDQVRHIDENELSQRITEFNSGDEINQLADSFNIMLDRLEQAFASQKRFSSDAAHELKTPLTVLMTNLEVLDLYDDPTAEQYQQLHTITKRQTQRMIQLVDDLFLMSENKVSQFDDQVDLDEMFDEIVTELLPQIETKEIEVSIDKSNITLCANRVMLTRAFSNLVENAIKYSENQATIQIEYEVDREMCCVSIKDRGIGINEDEVEHIFKPFYRVDQSRSRKIAGAGLGLAITKDIIENHKGKIRYQHNQPKGSIFTVSLPLK